MPETSFRPQPFTVCGHTVHFNYGPVCFFTTVDGKIAHNLDTVAQAVGMPVSELAHFMNGLPLSGKTDKDSLRSYMALTIALLKAQQDAKAREDESAFKEVAA